MAHRNRITAFIIKGDITQAEQACNEMEKLGLSSIHTIGIFQQLPLQFLSIPLDVCF